MRKSKMQLARVTIAGLAREKSACLANNKILAGQIAGLQRTLEDAHRDLRDTETALLKSEQERAVLQERINDKVNQLVPMQNRLETLQRELVKREFTPPWMERASRRASNTNKEGR